MSIKIRKYEGGEVFDLPKNYIIEGEKNNPLFEKKGSQTVPIAFPATVKNNRLLTFPFRLDKSNKQEGAIPVTVEAGSSQQRGLLSINSASTNSISANIGYDESEMYIQFAKMNLRDIPDLPVFDPQANTYEDNLGVLFTHLNLVMQEMTDADYFIFPAVLKQDSVDGENGTKNYYEILNELDTTLDPNNLPNGQIADFKARSNRSITRYEDGEEIEFQVPKGYGISPFLKVYRILELVFNHYGLEVKENPFKTHPQLKKLVVLNNTMDAILTGKLYHKDLMPDSTIQEFLDALYAKFGMLYFVDSNAREVRLKFLKDLVTPGSGEMIDLNRYKTGKYSISFSEPKQLRLKMNREIELAKVLYDTYEEFLDKFNFQFTETDGLSWPGTGTTYPGEITQVFSTTESVYKILNIFNTEESCMSSDFFDWDKKNPDIAYEEIEMKDLCVPIKMVMDGSAFILLHYLVNYKHLYSDIIVAGETQDNIENPAKLAFAFGWGLTSKTKPAEFNYFFASQFNRDEDGNFMNNPQGKKYDLSLTCNREDGLYNRFWKEYDAFIRHSNQEVSCDLHLSDMEILNMKVDQQLMIDNQPLVPKQIKYKLNKPGNISECVFRTLRLYEPCNLIEEQFIPTYKPQKYFWAFTVTDSQSHPTNYIRKHVIENNYYTVNGVLVPKSYISFLPPTEEQFLNQEIRTYQYRTFYMAPFMMLIDTTVEYHPVKVIY